MNAVSFDPQKGVSARAILDDDGDWDHILEVAEREIGFLHVGNALDLLREWILGGKFVVHAGNAYYLGADGDVESS